MITAFGSLFFILLIFALTDPSQNIAYALPFFLLLLIFLIALGTVAVIVQKGEISRLARQRVVLLSTIAVVLVMFSSTHSLNAVEAIILLLIGLGLNFYFNRR